MGEIEGPEKKEHRKRWNDYENTELIEHQPGTLAAEKEGEYAFRNDRTRLNEWESGKHGSYLKHDFEKKTYNVEGLKKKLEKWFADLEAEARERAARLQPGLDTFRNSMKEHISDGLYASSMPIGKEGTNPRTGDVVKKTETGYVVIAKKRKVIV